MTLEDILENHGTEKFPVTNEYLTRNHGLPAEMSMNELRKLRDDEWARIKADDDDVVEVFKQSSLWSALNTEIAKRRGERTYDKSHLDSSDLDKTYIYPGDPAPDGMKWVLVKDDAPGVVAYVEPEDLNGQ